jgi:hypothetical protein
MRKLLLAVTAVSMTMPVAFAAPAEGARRTTHHYYRTCHRHRGTTGAIVGGGAGALAGKAIGGHGLAGPLIGGVGGALLGRHIQRHNSRYRC